MLSIATKIVYSIVRNKIKPDKLRVIVSFHAITRLKVRIIEYQLKMDPELKEYLESIKNIVTETNNKLDKVNEKTEVLDREITELKEENQMLKSRLNNLEQYTRKFDVIINGIPKEDDPENLNEMINLLAEVLEVQLNTYDICGLHRLPTKPDKIPPTSQ